MSRPKLVVLHDADCGFCAKSANLLRTKWFAADIDLSSVQAADLAALGVDRSAALALMHAVLVNDADHPIETFTGHHAWAEILKRSREPWPIVGVLLNVPGISWVAAKVYAWVAANRFKLPGGTAACEITPENR